MKILARVVVTILVVIAVAIGLLFVSLRMGSYYVTYDCEGLVTDHTTSNEIQSTAHIEIERYHWFKLKAWHLHGWAKIEITSPKSYGLFHIVDGSRRVLPLSHSRGRSMLSAVVGEFSLLSQTLTYEPTEGLTFNGACSLRDEA